MSIKSKHGFKDQKSVYELNDANVKDKWRDRFDQMERDCFKINHQRGSVVFDVLNNQHIFNLVAPILGIDDPREPEDSICVNNSDSQSEIEERSSTDEAGRERVQDEEEDEIQRTEEKEGECEQDREQEELEEKASVGEKSVSTKGSIGEKSVSTKGSREEKSMSSKGSMIVEKSGEEEEEVDKSEIETGESFSSMYVEPPTKYEPGSKSYGIYSNCFMKFLKKPEEKAAIWRPKPKTVLAGVYKADPHMTLLEKSGIITNKITSEFCSWLRDLGGEEKTIINEEVLDELFSIGFDKPAARALTNRIREMPTLTSTLAKVRGYEEADYRYWIRQEIQSDITAAKKKPRRVAFGTNLKYPYRHDPTSSDLHNNWMEFKAPRELSGFTKVWEGQLHLKSTIGFCNYLQKNPHLRRPPYLARMGMFDTGSKYARVSLRPSDNSVNSVRPSLAGDSAKLSDLQESELTAQFKRRGTESKIAV